LFDEIDAVFTGRSRRENEELRALLNNGYRRGTPVLRCVGEGTKQVAKEFDSFCAKALAGIGCLPETIADRALPITLKRRGRDEHVERFRLKQSPAEAEPIRDRLAAWAAEHEEVLTDAKPVLPEALDDRAQDVAEPLLAIADQAGGDWPQRARSAVVEVRSNAITRDDDDLGVTLLMDIRMAFANAGSDRLSTEGLLHALHADDESPWASATGGNPITARGIARLLRSFGIRSRNIRLPDGPVVKGFKAEQFADSWRRYLPSEEPEAATSATPPGGRIALDDEDLLPVLGVADVQMSGVEHGPSHVADVAARDALTAMHSHEPRTLFPTSIPIAGDSHFPGFIDAKCHARVITPDEWLERRRVHALVEKRGRASSASGPDTSETEQR
jgi:hypothetical protein